MGRWRPPPEHSSPYITARGAETLRRELAELWQLRRRDVVPALSAAAAEGDRSENAEYIYRKKQLREIDRKIRYLSKRAEVMKIIDQAPPRRDRIYFGATVLLLDEDGQSLTYRIVGADEIGVEPHYISVDSPLARALLGHGAGDMVQAALPGGMAGFEVIAIEYDC